MHNIRFHHSLRFKLISAAILIEGIMLSGLIWNGMRLMESNLSSQMSHRVSQLRPLLNASLAGPLLQQDLVTLNEIVQQFVKTEIRYLAIYNAVNESMVVSGIAMHSSQHAAPGDLIPAPLRILDDTVLLQMPIELFNQMVGSLVMEVDSRFIVHAIKSVRTQSGLIALVGLVLSIFLLGGVGYALTQHLRLLTDAAQRIGEGNMEVRIPVMSRDEVGVAATTFNIMADRIAWDQGQLRERENKISQLNTQLERRVEQRTAELKAANGYLQDSVEQLKQTQAQLVQAEKMASLGGLVAGVAHEINTPVGVGVTAITHLQMKLDEYAARYESDELTREDFESMLKNTSEAGEIIRQNLHRAAELIRSFKQVAVDQTSNELRSFNLKEYLHEVMQSLRPKIKHGGHQVSIVCPKNLMLYSHPGALSQVITNLVMNSIIHGFDERQNGCIRIDVTEKTSGGIQLRYSDDGKGIEMKNLNKIFEPFFTTRRGQGGSGLGMHIVFNLVTQTLGGQIRCQSEVGKGVNFELDLPVGSESEIATLKTQNLAS